MRVPEAAREYDVSVSQDPAYFANHEREWDQLLEKSATNSIFMSAPWLDAWCRTLGQGAELKIARIFKDRHLIAACAFYCHDKTWLFAAHHAADYGDLLIDQKCGDEEYAVLVQLLLDAISPDSSAQFLLARIPKQSRTVRLLQQCGELQVTETASVGAPIMAMTSVEDRLGKKSLNRHARKLAKMGELVTHTSTDIDCTLATLDDFFSQHIARWEDTPFPSLFQDHNKREFYAALTRTLGRQGWLRFATVKLDAKMIAAHFGFQRDGVFTWYKPTYEPALAKFSPGEVLLKHLLEQARDEQAEYFDFTIGEEAFKLRFSTQVHQIVSLHLTRSRILASARRLRLGVSKRLKSG